VEDNVTSFEVKFQSQNSAQGAERSETVSATEHTLIGLQPAATYSVWVLAVDGRGGRSLSSDVMQCSTIQQGWLCWKFFFPILFNYISYETL